MPDSWGLNRRALSRQVGFSTVIGTILIIGLMLAPTPGGSGSFSRGAPARLTSDSTTITLSETGVGPTTISLESSESGAFCGSSSWTLEYSFTSSNGPWYELASVGGNVNPATWWGYGFAPGATYWYYAVRDDSCTGNSNSNTLQLTQPEVSALTYSTPTASTASFSWTNNAQYGGSLSFVSYGLNESVNGGPWSTVTTITTESTQSYTVNGLASGTGYSFQLITTDDYCNYCSGDYDTTSSSNVVTFGTPQPLVASATSSRSAADVGQSVSFSCAAVGGTSPYTYAWSFGDGSIGSGQTTSHQYSSAGTFTASCSVTDNSGTRSSSPVAMTISPAPSVNASVDHSQVSPGVQVSFTATAAGGPGTYTSYAWAFGDGATSSGSSVTHTFETTGTFHASVVVTDSNGVTASGGVLVVVSNLSVTAGVSQTGATTGQSLTFTAAASGGAGAPYTFSWDFGDGSTSTGSSVTHSYSSPGTYVAKVTATDSLGGTNTTSLATITVSAQGALGVLEMPVGGVPLYLILVVAVVVIVAAVLLVRRGRGKRAWASPPPLNEVQAPNSPPSPPK
jgi:PKD repeat protein